MSATETGLIPLLVDREALHIEKSITVDTAVPEPIGGMLHVVSAGTYVGVDKELYIGYSMLGAAFGMYTSVSSLTPIKGLSTSITSGVSGNLTSFVASSFTVSALSSFAGSALKFYPLNERIAEEKEILPTPKTELARLLLRHRESVRREGGKFRDVAEILAELEASRKRAMVL